MRSPHALFTLLALLPLGCSLLVHFDDVKPPLDEGGASGATHHAGAENGGTSDTPGTAASAGTSGTAAAVGTAATAGTASGAAGAGQGGEGGATAGDPGGSPGGAGAAGTGGVGRGGGAGSAGSSSLPPGGAGGRAGSGGSHAGSSGVSGASGGTSGYSGTGGTAGEAGHAGDAGAGPTCGAVNPCPTYSSCELGRCVRPTLGWVWQTEGTAWEQAVDLALASDGKLLVSATGSNGEIAIGSLYRKSANGSLFLARLDRTTGEPEAAVDFAPTGGVATDGRLSVAANGTPLLGIRMNGTWGGVDFTSEYRALAILMTASFAMNYEKQFYVGVDPATAEIFKVDDVVAANTSDYFLMSYDEHIEWNTNGPPYYDFETGPGCRTFLAQLDAATGQVGWSASYAWCSGRDGKVLKLGPDGELYAGGPGRSNIELEPPVLGLTQFTSAESAVLAKFDPGSGSVTRARELPCTLQGSVRDLAFFSNGDIVAAVTCAGRLTPAAQTLPDGSAYLLRLNSNLDLIRAAPLGAGFGPSVAFPELSIAVGDDDIVYVAGTVIEGDYDFGVGRHTWLGTCDRCAGGDAFVAAYTDALVSRWSLPIASTGEEHGLAIVRDPERMYVTFTLGGPATVLERDLVVTGRLDAAVLALTE